jgi:hypothetical protein
MVLSDLKPLRDHSLCDQFERKRCFPQKGIQPRAFEQASRLKSVVGAEPEIERFAPTVLVD